MAPVLRTRRRRFQLVCGALIAFGLGASSVQCGSLDAGLTGGAGVGGGGGTGGASGTTGTNSTNGTSGTNGTSTGSTGLPSLSVSSGAGGNLLGVDVVGAADYSAEQIYQDDPPPMTCDGGGVAAPSPGGTPQCPDDKNLPGCPCPTQGVKAACWTGLRKNRNHGDCKDGTTTCTLTGEVGQAWGECVGEKLPTSDTGKAACTCFSAGHWALPNLSPCFAFSDAADTMVGAVVSTTQNGQCPADALSVPTADWTTDTLTADCTGAFKLCYTLKAGNGASPQPTDCSVVSVCTDAYYSPANSTMTLPPLPGWLANDPDSVACAQKFADSGGYGEMSVTGQSDECEMVNKVFQYVNYCPLACGKPNPPAMCAQCTNGGGGDF